jgi:hypothetical protein
MNQNFRFNGICPTRELLAVRSRVEDPKPALVHSRLALISTMINYIDRQTLSALATFLQVRYHWNNNNLAWIFIVFTATYGIGHCCRDGDRGLLTRFVRSSMTLISRSHPRR